MGSGKPLPYMNGWILITVTFSIFYIVATYGAPFANYTPCTGTGCTAVQSPTWLQLIAGMIYSAARAVAGVFPAPLSGYLSTGIIFFAGITTLGLKFLDAPLGSGKRFKDLESQLARRQGVSNPAALAASIGRRKYGKQRFQQLSARARRRR